MLSNHEVHVFSDLILAAGRRLKEEAERPEGPRGSGSKAPVDDEIDAFLAKELRLLYPEDGILSEEGGLIASTNGRWFIYDPHDGTRDFLQGHRETSVAFAWMDKDGFRFAAVHAPFATPLTSPRGLFVTWQRGETFLRSWGEVVTLPAPPTSLEADDLVLVSRRLNEEALLENIRLLSPARVQPCASIATRLALVALGKAAAALTVRHTIAEWDFAAGQALLQATGGDLLGAGGVSITWSLPESFPKKLLGYFACRDLPLAAALAERYRHITG